MFHLIISWIISLFKLGRLLAIGAVEHLQHAPQAAQAHYVWVRASEVIWSEYTFHWVLNTIILLVFSTQWKESRLNGV